MIVTGTIDRIHGGGGLLCVDITPTDGPARTYYADNGPLVRALDAILGNVIQPGHTARFDSAIGMEVCLQVDDGLGFIEAITDAVSAHEAMDLA